MSEIPDADDFIDNYEEEHCAGEVYGFFGYPRGEVTKAMIDFAKLHVEAAKKAAQEVIGKETVPNCSDHTPFWGACITCGRYDNPEIPADEQTIKDAILKCYPLENIK